MSQEYRCKRKASGLGGAGWRWLELRLRGTARSCGSTRGLPSPPRLLPHRTRHERAPAAPARRARLRAGLQPAGLSTCCTRARGRDKPSRGDQHRSPPWDPRPAAAGTSTTTHPARGRPHRLHGQGCAATSSAFPSGCNFPRVFVKH